MHEREMFVEFRQRAKALYSNCPDIKAHSDWLLLMQHHGMPTRLLDWTKSFLVASYFVVHDPLCKNGDGTSYKDEDGVLWALQPQTLNHFQARRAGIFLAGDFHVRNSVAEVAEGRKPGQKTDGGGVIALTLPETDMQMAMQQTAATIHSTETPINKLERRQEFLLKFVVAAEAKPEIALALDNFGLRESLLFPSLDYLSQEVGERSLYDQYVAQVAT